METTETIGRYLIEQIYACGVRHIFGVPGDYILSFFSELAHSNLKIINACDEQGAGFMADAYARLRGLGVVCVTYGVGGFKVVNTTAQAFAEKSPVVVISGAPGMKERQKFPLLHHKVRDFDTQQKVFEQITVDSTILKDSQTASLEIDRVLSTALRCKLPVYIELPRDMVTVPIITHQYTSSRIRTTDSVTLQEALTEAVKMINAAKKPVIITGVELQRYGLREQLLRLAEKTNIPMATTILSKSLISESHPLYLGTYEGVMGHESTKEYVESSDCLIVLGVLMTDIYLDIFPVQIYKRQAIHVTDEKISVGNHNYENVEIRSFLEGLTNAYIKKREFPNIFYTKIQKEFSPILGQKITVQRLFERLNSFLTDNMIVLADIGDALFGSIDLHIRGRTKFLSPTYYESLGFAIPGSVGAQLANPDARILVLVGDGAFQMTGMELVTSARYNLNPIIIVLNNRGYGTERVMIDGSFNDIHPLKYSNFSELIGYGQGVAVETEDQLEQSLNLAERYTDGFYILDVHLEPKDRSPALQRISDWFAKRMD